MDCMDAVHRDFVVTFSSHTGSMFKRVFAFHYVYGLIMRFTPNLRHFETFLFVDNDLRIFETDIVSPSTFDNCCYIHDFCCVV